MADDEEPAAEPPPAEEEPPADEPAAFAATNAEDADDEAEDEDDEAEAMVQRPSQEPEPAVDPKSEVNFDLLPSAQAAMVDLGLHNIVKSTSKFSTRLWTKRLKRLKPCEPKPAWNCEQALWRVYMTKFTEDVKQRDIDEKKKYGQFGCIPRPEGFPRFRCVPSEPSQDLGRCYQLNALKISEWLREHPEMFREKPPSSSYSIPDWLAEFPAIGPCIPCDPIRLAKINQRKAAAKAAGVPASVYEAYDSPGSDSEEEIMEEFAKMKELEYAKIPFSHPLKGEGPELADACEGPNENLVYGDYVVSELHSSKYARTYAWVCLHGLTGMPVPELERVKEKAWKFDMFQGVVAMMAKTQFRYKYLWSPNIDYIYETAWHIFVHVGYLNCEKNLKLDDVLIYNYRYNVEIEQIDEINDVVIYPNMDWKFYEKNMTRVVIRHRRELTLTNSFFGEDKEHDEYRLSVHSMTKQVERWIMNIDDKYDHLIMKTGRFSIAFWRDGLFWYIYNPYRTDKIGFFASEGYACLTKHCSKEAMKRHLMILLIRAYAYSSTKKKDKDAPKERGRPAKRSQENDKSTDPPKKPPCDQRKRSKSRDRNRISIKMYQMIFRCCYLHNVKLFNRKRREDKLPMEDDIEDPCTFDPTGNLSPPKCPQRAKCGDENRECTLWLQNKKILWTKIPPKPNPCDPCNEGKAGPAKTKWHNFDILKPEKLYVLWGDIHLTDPIFQKENRCHQYEAVYAVCAGMVEVNVPEYWTGQMLNAVVVCGDRFYMDRHEKPPDPCKPWPPDDAPLVDPVEMWWDESPDAEFQIGTFRFHVRVSPMIKGNLFYGNEHCLWETVQNMFKEYSFAIYYCENTIVGIFKKYGAYYLIDARSYGPPIYDPGNGAVYLLRITCFKELIVSLILLTGTPECSEFQLRPIEICDIDDVGNEDECGVPRCPDPEICGKSQVELCKECPMEEEMKKCKTWSKSKSCKKKIQKDQDKMTKVSCHKKPC